MSRSFIYDPPEEVEKNYLENGCSRCPFCGSKDIHVIPASHEDAKEVLCENCREHWLECYEIVGILLETEYPGPFK